MSARTPSGFALPSVVVALTIIEALVAVAFVAAMSLARASAGGVAHLRALEAAEAGLVRAMTIPSLPEWDTATVAVTLADARLPGGAAFHATLLPAGPRTVVLHSEGASSRAPARAAIAAVVTRRPAVPSIAAAFTFGGELDVQGAVWSRGQPTAASEWSPCGAPAAAPDVLALAGDSAIAAIDRLPHDVWRPFATPIPAGVAAVWPEPAIVNGQCDSAVWSNWGDPVDPEAPCGSHYTIVYYDGALRIAGGRGQGVLVSMGDLTIGGDFRFHGLVAVRGRLVVEEPGTLIVGTLLVGAVLGQRHAVRGTLAVQYSKCMLELGLPGAGAMERLPGPSWLHAYDVP